MLHVKSIRLAAAQSSSVAGALAANVAHHCQFIEAARAAAVDVLVFPELSLSGYELALLAGCVLDPGNAVLAPIREAALLAGLTVVVGAPISSGQAFPHIGAIAFCPDGRAVVYGKRLLHPGEERFVLPSSTPICGLPLGDDVAALAICAEITHPEHAQGAAALGASMYLAGVLITEAGYAADAECMRHYAEHHGFAALMANHAGPSGGYVSAGRSAIWAPGGELLAEAGKGHQLVMASKSTRGWQGEVRAVDV